MEATARIALKSAVTHCNTMLGGTVLLYTNSTRHLFNAMVTEPVPETGSGTIAAFPGLVNDTTVSPPVVRDVYGQGEVVTSKVNQISWTLLGGSKSEAHPSQ